MKLTFERDQTHETRTFTLVITDVDLVKAPLDEWDRFLVRDVEANLATSETPISDALLALHAIAWRVEQEQLVP